MPFTLNPVNYASVYNPQNLGVVQHGLESRQNRSDISNASWADAKSKLYEEASYDPEIKKEVIKSIESNFDRLYRDYSGDMSQATGDLMNMIANSRKNDYFRLNKTALEEQKKYEALKQAYGAKGLEFRGMKQGLKDEKGNWRRPEDFKAEVVQDLERDQKLAAIIEQSLKNVSREGNLQGGDYPGMLKRTTVSGKGILQGKGEQYDKTQGIYNEYLKTAEGQLHLRMLKELPGYKSDDPEKALHDYVDAAIKNRIAPPSYSTDDMNAPNNNTGTDKLPTDIPYLRSPIIETSKSDNKLFKDDKSVFDLANKSDGSAASKIANQRLNEVNNSKRGMFLRGMIANAAKNNGLDPDDILSTKGYLSSALPPVGNKQSSYSAGKVGQTGLEAPNRSKPTQASSLERIALTNYIADYNEFLKEELQKVTDYKNFQWNDFDIGKAYAIGGDKLADVVDQRSKRVTNIVSNMPIDSWVFENSSLAGKEIKDSDREKWKVDKVYIGGDPLKGNFAVGQKTSDGQFHITRPKSFSQAMSIVRAAKDTDARYAAIADFIDFLPNSVVIASEGGNQEIKLPVNVKINKDENGLYNVTDNGKRVEFSRGNGLPYEVALYLQANMYINVPELETEIQFLNK